MLVKLLNLEGVLKQFEDIEDLDLSEPLKKATMLVQGEAKKLAPINKIKTAPTRGNLRASIRRDPLQGGYKNGGSVSTNVEYAPYVEFGTYKMLPQPFMIPALKNNERRIKDLIVNETNKQIEKKTK